MQKHYGLIAQGEALPKNSHPLSTLLPIHQHEVGGKRIQVVHARELHAFLKVGRDFSTWVQERIREYRFIEELDYTVVETLSSPISGSTKARPQRVKEYHLALNMAKELAMVERNDEGRQARHYFIDCERRLSIVAPEQQAVAVAHWQAQREVTKDYHGLMCRALQQTRICAGKETKAHHYSNELNMLNRLVLGVDAKHWAELHGGCREVRQHMDCHQLEQIAYLERSNATLIDACMPFAERKARLSSMLAAHVDREGWA
ncbi:antA/AntB antirepressor family protein [Aeromonas rivipollensis]|uniref:antA/AntB antirepressor family protein n=1 Tax=Aeromonas rivipollensis TaxID=948519 RepID=UPI001F459135|nr:antA/AntB antirepressor family protein [Aeromonas rivipollensis]MCE9957148.1 antA/AntB antirepressor family protein [Aeromonas rivipollensis]